MTDLFEAYAALRQRIADILAEHTGEEAPLRETASNLDLIAAHLASTKKLQATLLEKLALVTNAGLVQARLAAIAVEFFNQDDHEAPLRTLERITGVLEEKRHQEDRTRRGGDSYDGCDCSDCVPR